MLPQGKNYIKLSFMAEKKEGHGEDAPPLLVTKEHAYAVGVFDGMGGAGAATCESDYGEGYTKAYVASRIVQAATTSYLEKHLASGAISVEDIKAHILERLTTEQEKYPPKTKSLLRSKLVREYPTTMAVVILQEKDNRLHIDSYWAGDSHCYLWTKKGFYQISKDDLEEDNDPLENLHNDAPISNCICADRDFYINHKHITIDKETVIVLCATDGCFGYFPTPMHFEDVLKRSLSKSKDEKDWQFRLNEKIQKVTGDDTSLSLIAIGSKSFEKLKELGHRKTPMINNIKNLEQRTAELKKEMEKVQRDYQNSIASGWKSYKQTYMKYINKGDEGNAER